MSKPAPAAPDVDLRSQGLPNHYILAGVAVAIGVLLYGRGGKGRDGLEEVATADGDDDEGRWLPWLLVWLVVRLVQVVLAGAACMLAVLVFQQRKILYVPAPPGTMRSTKDNPSMFRSPDSWGLPFEDLMIPTADGTKVNAWLVYQPWSVCKNEAVYTFVYYHGNAGNIGHRLENIRDMHSKLNVNILIVDYRGYGDSEDGDGPNERGFMMDALATYRWLVDRIRSPTAPKVTNMSEDRILFFGRSIGGAVAIKLMAQLIAERRRLGPESLPVPAGLILENTFTSLRDMAVQIFPFLAFLKFLLRSPLVFDEWKSSDSLRYITSQHEQWCCCLLSGGQDQIVPPAQMRELHGILKEQRPKVLKFFVFPLGGHNDTPIRGGAEYWRSFQKFMATVVETEVERRQASTLGDAQPDAPMNG